MTDEAADGRSDGAADEQSESASWPVDLRGVTETVVTTRGPNDLWNVAALGVHAPGHGDADADASNSDATGAFGTATATTWGNTRTRRNFHREGGGYVQFVADPVVFVDAALSIREEADPVLDAADAWASVEAEHVDTTDDDGTRREHWQLRPVEAEVVAARPHTVNRGSNAVVEATVAASRLDVPASDTETLHARLEYFADVARTCGGERERVAIERLHEHADLDSPVDGDW